MVTAVAERTEHRVEHRPTTPVWVVLIGVLLLLAVGFGGGFLTSQAVQSDPVGLASESVVQVMDENLRAASAGDEVAYAATFTADAELIMLDSGVELARYQFPKVIAREMGQANDLTRTSEVVQHGKYVSAGYSEAGSEGVVVMEIVDGKIATEWILVDTYR